MGSAEPAVAQVAPPDSSAGAEKPVAAIDAGTPQRPTTGALSISSKPPCEILVDGKPLGLRTPQLDVQLAPGVHKITLVNVEFGIEDSFSIEIAAGERVRTSKDFSDKLKRVEVPSKTTTINPFGK